ncbi:MAG: hypothetical protein ACRETA_05165 [Gammaproteobacteria bacterium]
MKDTQIIELRGRLYLQAQLLAAHLEIAVPARDRGIDIIAYADRDLKNFVAKPIQLKASSRESFGIFKKYKKTPDLLLVFVWNLAKPGFEASYALTYKEALDIAKKLGWTKTDSWRVKGGYGTTTPSNELKAFLAPYKMSLQKWRQKLISQRNQV